MQIWSSHYPIYNPLVTSYCNSPIPHFLALASLTPALTHVSPSLCSLCSIILASSECLELAGALHDTWLFTRYSLCPECPAQSSSHLHHTSWPTNSCSFFKVQLNPDCPRLQQVPWMMLSCYFFFLNMYFAARGLSCSTRDLCCRVRDLLVAACGILYLQRVGSSSLPDHGSNPGPLRWERGVLTTGPPEKSLSWYSMSTLLGSYPTYLNK